MEKTSSQILLDAANLLQGERKWNQGSYFKLDENAPQGCSMCAHGAIAYCGSPEVKEAVLAFNILGALSLLDLAAAAAIYPYYNNLAALENLTVPEYLLKYYGEAGLAHYKAAKAGLTFIYNDLSSTTKEDVISKLREAASL